MIVRFLRSAIPIPRLCLVMLILAGTALGFSLMGLMSIVTQMGESQGWLSPIGDQPIVIWIITIAMASTLAALAAWLALVTIRMTERLLVHAGQAAVGEPPEVQKG